MVETKRSKISGTGAFATRTYEKGARVMRLTGRKLRSAAVDRLIESGKLRIDDPFEIGGGYYLVLDHTPLMANHSCSPNTGVRGTNQLIALRTIRAGEELTYDYSTVVGKSASHESDWHMRCRCGARACRKRIGNWESLPLARLNYYFRNRAIPDFILKEIITT